MTDVVRENSNNGNHSHSVVLAVCDDLFGKAIVDFVLRHSWKPETTFHLVYVVELDGIPIVSPDLTGEIEKDETEYGEKLTAELSSKIHAAFPECKVKIDLVRGSARYEILRVAESVKAELIVVGSHGRTGLKKLVLGSVSAEVMTHAKCSTMVVRIAPEEVVLDISPPGLTVEDLPEKMTTYNIAV